MSRHSDNDTTRITVDARNEIKGAVARALRHMQKSNAYPYTTCLVDVYHSCFPPEALKAAQTIWQHMDMRSMLRQANYAQINATVATRIGRDIEMGFMPSFPHNVFVRTVGSYAAPSMKPSNPFYYETVEWMKRCVMLNLRATAVENLVDKVVDNCSTFGQLARLWPMLANAVPPTYQSRLSAARGQKRTSPLPSCIADRIDDYRNAIRVADTMLAESLLWRDAVDNGNGLWCTSQGAMPVPDLLERARYVPFALVPEENIAWLETPKVSRGWLE